MNPAVRLSKLPRAEQWADRIRAQHQKSVESVMETGRLLLKAKADLVHGEWGRMFEEELIPFTRQTAFKLMTIAGNPQLSNVAHVQHLPASWGTLYELTKVPEPTLKNALRDGVITPDMPRKAVSALIPERPEPHGVRTQIVEAFDEREALHLLIHGIRSVIAKWPGGHDITPVIECLQREAQSLDRRRAS